MNYGLARIIKEPLYQALRNTMYIIIGAFALTIYSMFVVNDKGAHSALAVGTLFSQCIMYIGGYFIVLFMICYTCQNISLAVSFSCTRKQAVVGVYIIEFLMGIFLIIVSVAGALTAGLMGVDISLGIWILQAVLVMLICIAVANIGSSITLKVGRIGYMSMVLIMGFAMGIMTVFIKSTLAAGMEKNMEEIAKIFKINKTGIMQTFIILIICSVAGNIIHDVIMLMENIGLVEKDYTVFPMGSFMVIIGIIATVIFAATTYNYTRFNMDVSYGCTRKMYIIRQWVFDIVVIIMAWAGLGITYLYENWKFAAFYSEYSLELSITPLFHFKYFVVSLIMLSSFNMLISSLIIKYGIKGRRIMAFAYMIICFSMAKAENIYQGIYERILTLPIGTDILLWLVTLIIAAVSAVVAILLIKKQQVAN